MAFPYLPVVLSILVTLQGVIISLYILKSYTTDINSHMSPVQNLYQHLPEQNQNVNHFRNFLPRQRNGNVRGKNVLLEEEEVEEDLPVLFIAVLSGISFTERRNAIRQSWMKDCKHRKKVTCKFFTDGLDVKGLPLANATIATLQKESRENHDDLVVVDSPSGRNFVIRLLVIMEWVKENGGEFDFFLRLDDDHFLCLDRLLKELPYRPRERLYWGHLHCVPGVVRIDEGWLMLTEDLVRTFLKTKETLQCSRFADQALAMWIYDLMKKKSIIWYGDTRIFHHPPASTISEFKLRKEICRTYLSLHGSYPIEMRVFQLINEREKQIFGPVYDIPPTVDTCPYLRENFNWKWFDPTYYTEPIPCKEKPIWSAGGDHFLGRSIDIRNKIQKDRANEKRWRQMHHINISVKAK